MSIPFDPAMPARPPGPRDDGGVRASHWYASVKTWRGFARPRPPRDLPDRLGPMVEASRPHHEALAGYASD